GTVSCLTWLVAPLSVLTSAKSNTGSEATPYRGRYIRLPRSRGGDQPLSPEALLPLGRKSSSPSDGRTKSPRWVTNTGRPATVVAWTAATLFRILRWCQSCLPV